MHTRHDWFFSRIRGAFSKSSIRVLADCKMPTRVCTRASACFCAISSLSLSLSLLPLLYRGLVHEELFPPRLQSTRVLNDWHRKLVKLALLISMVASDSVLVYPTQKKGTNMPVAKSTLGGCHAPDSVSIKHLALSFSGELHFTIKP